jgi:hypothetical protein
MKTIMFILSLAGTSSDNSIDPATIVAKEIIKGVYDESRVETMAFSQEKYPQNQLD